MKGTLRDTGRLLLFWGGWPSQWTPARFHHEGVDYSCCEQWMMAEKARVFGDHATLARILAAVEPGRHKALGRQVRGFDAAHWSRVCRGIVYRGNLLRFTQIPRDRDLLLATDDRTLVEASPLDRIWGIGLRQDDPRALVPSQWLGSNWLGVALMQVRDTLRGVALDDATLAAQLAARATPPT